MTKLTIELDDHAVRLAVEGAQRANLTLSEWIGERIARGYRKRALRERDAMGYPLGWFEHTVGSLADLEDFRESADLPSTFVAALEL